MKALVWMGRVYTLTKYLCKSDTAHFVPGHSLLSFPCAAYLLRACIVFVGKEVDCSEPEPRSYRVDRSIALLCEAIVRLSVLRCVCMDGWMIFVDGINLVFVCVWGSMSSQLTIEPIARSSASCFEPHYLWHTHNTQYWRAVGGSKTRMPVPAFWCLIRIVYKYNSTNNSNKKIFIYVFQAYQKYNSKIMANKMIPRKSEANSIWLNLYFSMAWDGMGWSGVEVNKWSADEECKVEKTQQQQQRDRRRQCERTGKHFDASKMEENENNNNSNSNKNCLLKENDDSLHWNILVLKKIYGFGMMVKKKKCEKSWKPTPKHMQTKRVRARMDGIEKTGK